MFGRERHVTGVRHDRRVRSDIEIVLDISVKVRDSDRDTEPRHALDIDSVGYVEFRLALEYDRTRRVKRTRRQQIALDIDVSLVKEPVHRRQYRHVTERRRTRTQVISIGRVRVLCQCVIRKPLNPQRGDI